jgi:ATP-dependent protease Clp ATPase subunit
VKKLIAGPTVYICERCIAEFTSLLLDDKSSGRGNARRAGEVSTKCSFCGKKRSEAWQLVEGASHNICSECLGICNEILADDGMAEAAGEDRLAKLSEHNAGKKLGYVRRVWDRIRGGQSAAI